MIKKDIATLFKRVSLLLVLVFTSILFINKQELNGYNYWMAKYYIHIKDYRYVVFERPECFDLHYKQQGFLTRKHGFEYVFLKEKDSLSEQKLQHIYKFNLEMQRVLESRNGLHWEKLFAKDVDSLMVLNSKK